MKGRFVVFLLMFYGLQGMAQNEVRPVEELIAPGDTGWIAVREWIKVATNKVEVLPRDSIRATDALYHVQVTTRSVMGAVIFETGGLLIDHGWIRILGSGCPRLNRSMPDWNQGKTFTEYGEHTPYYLIADDVLGGLFALNGGGLGSDVGKIYYLSPTDLKWRPMNYAYSGFLQFCFFGDLDALYKGFRWNGWEHDADILEPDMCYLFRPALWNPQGADVKSVKRSTVPVAELYNTEMAVKKGRGLNSPEDKK